MHWTALLQARTFPPDATVIDNLPCANCGYNCRGCRAASNCPECGIPIGDSLYTLTKPETVAGGFDMLAKSWLPLFLLYAGCIHSSLYGALQWIILCALIIASAFRLYAVFTLCFRANLHALPLIGTRLHLLFILALIDLTCISGFTVTYYLDLKTAMTTTAVSYDIISAWLAVGWTLNLLLLLWTTGWLGGAMATLLEYENIEKEFRRVRLFTVFAGILMVLSVIMVQFITFVPGTTKGTIVITGMIMPAFPLFIVLCYTFVGCLHLAGAAPRETEPLDEKVDKPRESFAHRTTPGNARQSPPVIPLADSDKASE